MDAQREVLAILDETLGLGGRTMRFTADTVLLGAVPELDSMAVIALINAMQEHFDFIADDDDIDGSTFATVGSLVAFVESKSKRPPRTDS